MTLRVCPKGALMRPGDTVDGVRCLYRGPLNAFVLSEGGESPSGLLPAGPCPGRLLGLSTCLTLRGPPALASGTLWAGAPT